MKITAEKTLPENSQNPAKLQVTENAEKPEEIGGVKGPEPTRYGDWEKNGRVSDF